MYCNRQHAWWSTQSLLATLLSLVGRTSDYDGSDLKTSIDEMVGPGALAAIRPTGVYLLDFFATVFFFMYC